MTLSSETPAFRSSSCWARVADSAARAPVGTMTLATSLPRPSMSTASVEVEPESMPMTRVFSPSAGASGSAAAKEPAAAWASLRVPSVSPKASRRVRSWPALWLVPSVSILSMGVPPSLASSEYSKP